MLFQDNELFREFCKNYGAQEAFVRHLIARSDAAVYENVLKLAAMFIVRQEKLRAALLIRDVLNARVTASKETRSNLIRVALSLREPGDLDRICTKSPTAFCQIVSEVITNFCKHCSEEIK